MPLPKSCSMATFYKSVEKEKASGKPLRQALAIAYSHLKKVCGVGDDFSGTPSEIVHKGGGSTEGLREEIWPSVAGANEVRKFYHKADEATIKKFEELYAGGKLIDAIRVMEKVLGIEFAPFTSNVITKFLEWYAKPAEKSLKEDYPSEVHDLLFAADELERQAASFAAAIKAISDNPVYKESYRSGIVTVGDFSREIHFAEDVEAQARALAKELDRELDKIVAQALGSSSESRKGKNSKLVERLRRISQGLDRRP